MAFAKGLRMHRSNLTLFAGFFFAVWSPLVSPEPAVARPALPIAVSGGESRAPGFFSDFTEALSQTVILLYYLQGHPDCLATDLPTLENEPGCLYFQSVFFDRQLPEQPAGRSSDARRPQVRRKVWFGGAPLRQRRREIRVHHGAFQEQLSPGGATKRKEE